MRIAQDLSMSQVRKAGKSLTVRSAARFTRGRSGRMRFGPDRRHESERGHALSLGAGERLAPAALKADWMAKRGENGPKRGQNGDFCGNMLRYYLVSDRPSRLFSAQQETV